MPDAIVGAIFGKGCANLVCDGSMIVSVDPNPTIALLSHKWSKAGARPSATAAATFAGTSLG